MKKSLCLFVLVLFSSGAYPAQGNFTIKSIGASNNTNTVFIETAESANESTTCSNKKLFRLPYDDQHADKLFSLALAAQAQDKKITIDYAEIPGTVYSIMPTPNSRIPGTVYLIQ